MNRMFCSFNLLLNNIEEEYEFKDLEVTYEKKDCILDCFRSSIYLSMGVMNVLANEDIIIAIGMNFTPQNLKYFFEAIYGLTSSDMAGI